MTGREPQAPRSGRGVSLVERLRSLRLRLVVKRPRLWSLLQRAVVLGIWVGGGGALLVLVFGVFFYTAMRVEMRSTEVDVPNITGMTLEAAAETVEPVDLVLEVVDQRHDPTLASGRVLQQMPPAETSVRRGRKIKLILSLGGRVLEVPELIGRTSRTVEIELRQEGFVPGDEARIPSFRVEAGTVIAQVPPPGTPAVPNTRVHRLVSQGLPEVAWVMPDLSGLTRPAAERWIALAGFRRGAVRRVTMGGRTAGTVVGQLPLAGHPVRSRDVVELTVVR